MPTTALVLNTVSTTARIVAATAQPTVSVLIVNYRTADLTIAAVESALAQPEATEIIVVDNASGDDSFERLTTQFRHEHTVRVVASPRNRGFGAGNNLAARSATGDLLFLLNSDAQLHPNALAALVTQRQAEQGMCIIAPFIHAGSGSGLQVDALGPFPTVRRIITQQTKRYGTSLTPDWVSGCALMIDRALFEQIGGFDERIFMYFEDVLLCWQVRRLGHSVLRQPEARVTHLGGKSYRSPNELKLDYFNAQDVYLRATGTSPIGISAVKLARRLAITLGLRGARGRSSKQTNHA